jgi:hypothetical protein
MHGDFPMIVHISYYTRQESTTYRKFLWARVLLPFNPGANHGKEYQMSQNTNQQSGQKSGGMNQPNKSTASDKQRDANASTSTRDPNQIKDPNREAQKGGNKNDPGNVTGKSDKSTNRDVNRSQSFGNAGKQTQ